MNRNIYMLLHQRPGTSLGRRSVSHKSNVIFKYVSCYILRYVYVFCLYEKLNENMPSLPAQEKQRKFSKNSIKV